MLYATMCLLRETQVKLLTHRDVCLPHFILQASLDEDVEQHLEISRTSHVLGVKLDAEKWPTFMYYSLICLVVCICKED